MSAARCGSAPSTPPWISRSHSTEKLDGDPPVWDDYRQTIKDAGLSVELQPLDKWKFYEAVSTDDHVLTIQTADQQRYANILLTIGVRMD